MNQGVVSARIGRAAGEGLVVRTGRKGDDRSGGMGSQHRFFVVDCVPNALHHDIDAVASGTTPGD